MAQEIEFRVLRVVGAQDPDDPASYRHVEVRTVNEADNLVDHAREAWRNSKALNEYGTNYEDVWPYVYLLPEQGQTATIFGKPFVSIDLRFEHESDELVWRSRLWSSVEQISLNDLNRLLDLGYLRGRRGVIVTDLPEGRGGEGGLDFDLAAFLLDQGVDLGIEFARDVFIYRLVSPMLGRLRNSRRDRAARRVASEWKSKNLLYAWQLRELVDRKNLWSAEELAKALRVPKPAARRILKALGYQKNAAGKWQPGVNRKHRKRRDRWLAGETAFDS